MPRALRKRDALLRYSAALVAAAVATMLAHSLPHHQDNPIFGFLIIGTLVVTWYFDWQAGVTALVFGTLGLLSLSFRDDVFAMGLKPGMAIRIGSNLIINGAIIFAVSRIRLLERRNSYMLKHERHLGRRQAAALVKLQRQVQLTESSNERLALALQAASSGTFEADMETATIRWSAELAALHGYPAASGELSYGRWLELMVPGDRHPVDAAVQSSLRTGELSSEWRIRRQDTGEIRWMASRGRVSFSPEGKPVRMIGIIIDITERKLAEEALIRSEKLASVGRMAAAVAHEVNNPLETIVNSVYIASLDPNLSPQTRMVLDAAEHELARVAHLTRQALGFYHESSAPAKVDLSDVVQGVLDLFSPKFREKQLSIEVSKGSECFVNAVAGELRHVVSNLVTNAIEASRDGGEVKLRTRVITLRDSRCVCVTVADTGRGIPPDDLGRIFEPFFTTREEVGTGLGLWVSSEIVQRHRGRIRVKSRPDRGTVFCVYLPAFEQSEPAAANALNHPRVP